MSYNLKCCSFYPNNFDASALMVGYIYMYLCVLSPRRSDDSFNSLERELSVTYRMLERDYKLSLDDRRLLLGKAKAAVKNITKKD